MQAKETTVQKMLTGTKVFLVPLFQRRYKWAAKDWSDLWDDILDQYYSEDVASGRMREGEGHFLGSVVLHPAPGPASTVARYLVVDGQQRLTTLMIVLAAIRDQRTRRDPSWNALAYDHQLLSNPFNPEEPYRLIPGRLDQEAFRRTMYEGQPTGQQGRAFRFFKRAVAELVEADGLEAFQRLERTILLRLLLVDISTSPSDNVNHIFHTLNYSGQKLSALDLVRNRLFMSLPSNEVEDAFELEWQPMEQSLGEAEMQRYIWAQCARLDARATQKDLYPAFERWVQGRVPLDSTTQRSLRPELRELNSQSALYRAILTPAQSDEGSADGGRIPSVVLRALRELAEWGSGTHIPATLECLVRLDDGRIQPDDAAVALRHFLSFMVRRTLAGIPTNNLNRIFTALPSALQDGPMAPQVARQLLSEQRYWPSDTEVLDRSSVTPLYATAQPSQVKFILSRIEAALPSPESVSLVGLEVEHVLPQKPSQQWDDYLAAIGDSPERARALIHTIGNLTLTGQNEHLARLPFERKKDLYRESLVQLSESIVVTDEWSSTAIESRSRTLGAYAVAIWQRPEGRAEVDLPPAQELGVVEVLLAMNEDGWTTPASLAEFLGRAEPQILEDLSLLGAELQMKVLTAEGALGPWLDTSHRAAVEDQLRSSGYPLTAPVYETEPMAVDSLRLLIDELVASRGD